MTILAGGISALLSPDLREVAIETGKDRPREYPLWCNIVEDMEWRTVTDQQVTGLGTAQPMADGEQFPFDQPLMGGTKSYTAEAFGLAIEITWQAWRDELYGVLQEMIRCLARASLNREEVSFHAALNNAFDTAFVGFTAGESLCSTSHVGADGETRANRPAVDIGVSMTYLQGAIQRFESMEDERGLPRLMAPVLYMVTPQDRLAAREILGSGGKPYTAQNEINALVDEDLSIMISHRITSGYHFLLAAKGVHDITGMWRDKPMFDMFDDPRNKNAIATMYQRHTTSQFGMWRGVDGSFSS